MGNSSEGASPGPLVVSSIAARRLRFLHHENEESGSVKSYYNIDADSNDADGHVTFRLRAALLQGPREPAPEPAEWEADRDPSAEVWVSIDTLLKLQIPAGVLVRVDGPRSRIARLMALGEGDDSDEGRGTAFLPPMLAHNLGLRLHLDALSSCDGSAAAVTFVRIHRHPIAIPRLETPSGAVGIRVPGAITHLPIAGTVHIAELRLPSSSFIDLFTRPPESADGKGTSDGSTSAVIPGPETQKASEDEDNVVKAVEAYFTSGRRVVNAGDALAIVVPTGHGASADYLSGGVDTSKELLHLIITSIAPGAGPCIFVPGRTSAILQGRASGAIPACVEAFLGLRKPREGPLDSGIIMPEIPGLRELLPHWRQLAGLLAPALHPLSINLPLRLAVLVVGPEGSGKNVAVRAATQAVGCHLVSLNCHALKPADSSDAKVLEAIAAAFDAASKFGPTALFLTHMNALGDQQGGQSVTSLGAALSSCIRKHGSARGSQGPVILIGACSSADGVAAAVRRCFTHEVVVEQPDLEQRAQLLRGVLESVTTEAALDEGTLEEIAQHTGGLLPRELCNAVAEGCARAVQAVVPTLLVEDEDVNLPDAESLSTPTQQPVLQVTDLNGAMDTVRSRMASDIGAPKIPDVKWEDVGGLEDVKDAILDTVDLPLRHPELFTAGLRRRSGVLLYGPPGTGKTLLAKAVATECSINFMSVKGPELINMYIGESERQVREVFERARRASPCVVFFDELDSLAPARGRGSDSGGVMDRVVSQLLAEIDNAQGNGSVFLIGATNRPDLLDPALLRPGRLDKLLYVGIARDPSSKEKVLEALTRKFALTDDINLEEVAHRCPSAFTGADVYALCSDAWMGAFRRLVLTKGSAEAPAGSKSLPKVTVSQADFLASLETLQPSLSEEEIQKYERIRDQYASESV